MNEIKKIKIEFSWLEKYPTLNMYQLCIIAYLKVIQNNGYYCNISQKDLASLFRIKPGLMKVYIKDLINQNIIFLSQDSKYIKALNNKKAIILVDKDNPLPELIETNKYIKQE